MVVKNKPVSNLNSFLARANEENLKMNEIQF